MALVRTFSLALIWRIAMMASAIAASVAALLWDGGPRIGLALFFGALAGAAAYSLFRYVNDTNRRLARFFESVRYSDFAIRFAASKEKGDSFAEKPPVPH